MNLLPKWPFRRHQDTIAAAARAVQADVFPHHVSQGVGTEWSPTEYGEYYPRSVPIYSAITIRANSMTRLPWRVHTLHGATATPVPLTHPAQLLLDNPNPWYSGAELRRATEIFLCLYGRAFWTLELSEDGTRPEIWPVRPDRMHVIPGRGRRGPYIKGYLYRGLTGDVPYLPEEVEMFSLFNPLQDRTGLSPIAPLRLSADMGTDALRYNRNTLRNGAIPDYVMLADDELTESQVAEFYERWEARFQGPARASRPAIASNIRDVKQLAFSNRELEFLQSLRWTVKDASRVYGVPETMLAELQYASLANMEVLERWYWRATIKPQATMMAERIGSSTLPKLGYRNLQVKYDYSGIEALNEGRDERIERETEFLDRGVVTINEIRQGYDMAPVAWGNKPNFREPTPPGTPPGQRTPTEREAELHGIPVNGQTPHD